MEKLCFLLTLLFPVVLCQSDRDQCSQLLRDLLIKMQLDFNIENDTLSVNGFWDGDSLNESTSADDLVAACSTSRFNIDLWRAIKSPAVPKPDDFGSREYFNKFQNCENPNPDLLWKHGNSISVTLSRPGENFDQDDRNVPPVAANQSENLIFARPVTFLHVVERQYIIRICPCRDNKEHKCSCDHGGGGKAVCSEIFNVTEDEREDQVFQWCRDMKVPAPIPELGTPFVKGCPLSLVILTGVLPSCTPVRAYDYVEIVLQPMHHGISDCQEPLHDGNSRIHRLIHMEPVNKTHGNFSIDIRNITHDTLYCLRVELVNHPYCNSGSDITLNRLSSICRPVSLKTPIKIPQQVCGRQEPCSPNHNLPLIAGSSLFAALFLAIGLLLFHRHNTQRRNLSSEESALQRHLLQTTPLHPDIFFLYWEESPDFGEINRLVVRWLIGLGHRVLDLADDLLQEEIMASPECWVLEKLENPNIKVIVVESETVAGCLKAEPDATVCTRTAGIDGLRLISLRHIQARLASNYQRLSVVQYASGPRRAEGTGQVPTLVPHTRYSLPEHLAELQAWLVDTQSWDDNGNQESAREQTLKDLKAAVKRYTDSRL